MNYQSKLAWVILLATSVSGMWALRLGRAQVATPVSETPLDEAALNDFRGADAAESEVAVGLHPASAIQLAAEAIRDAEGADAKAAADKRLADLLGAYFDKDMLRREAELKKIEERLAKLRELLSRRRTNRQEIIELQAKVAINEAEGLGFYDGGSPGANGFDDAWSAEPFDGPAPTPSEDPLAANPRR